LLEADARGGDCGAGLGVCGHFDGAGEEGLGVCPEVVVDVDAARRVATKDNARLVSAECCDSLV
jgi:hypothetical protein